MLATGYLAGYANSGPPKIDIMERDAEIMQETRQTLIANCKKMECPNCNELVDLQYSDRQGVLTKYEDDDE